VRLTAQVITRPAAGSQSTDKKKYKRATSSPKIRPQGLADWPTDDRGKYLGVERMSVT